MGKDWDSFKSGRAAAYSAGGELITAEQIEERRGKGGAGPSYVNRPAKRCKNCGKQAWSGSPCRCEQPEWELDNSPLHAAQEWHQAWATEALRVLKPGGHLLAFGGTRTYHRLVCAVEDAGFEIRDTISWLYGSGFPKSLDVGKAIDKRRKDGPAIRAVTRFLAANRNGHDNRAIDAHFDFNGMADHWTTQGDQPRVPTVAQWAELKALLSLPDEMDAEVWRLNGRKGQPGDDWELREVVDANPNYRADSRSEIVNVQRDEPALITAPATPEAERWEGWGTALKPAHEPVVVARKPLAGTVAGNVLEHGTGALNVDGCRVGTEDDLAKKYPNGPGGATFGGGEMAIDEWEQPSQGRWPANVVLSHTEGCVQVGTRKVKGAQGVRGRGGSVYGGGRGYTADFEVGQEVGYTDADGTETVGAWSCTPDCPVRLLDEQSGERPGMASQVDTKATPSNYFGLDKEPGVRFGRGDSGGASRFFYVAKASRGERNAGLEGFEERVTNKLDQRRAEYREDRETEPVPAANHHPTVKPISLMRWLVRLVTPPGGTVLDPFCGSGTTGCAAVLEGFDFVGLEREPEYVAIAEARIRWWHKHRGDGEAAEILAAGELRDEVEATGQLGMFDEPEPVDRTNREGEASAERRYTERGGSNFAMKPGRRRV